MLSVLIPTHDFVCYALVESLCQQATRLAVPFEIIVAEDGGHNQVAAIANHKINDLPHCRYERRRENVGRARIRNYLISQARGERLLLLDSDARVERPDFLERYLREDAPVVVGGLYHAPQCPDPQRSLRHRYERQADTQRSAAQRMQHPYQEFTTFNVLLRRSVVERVQFCEECKEYGYEDVLFGVHLQQHGIPVLHIDNPLLHTGIDTNSAFLQKTEESLRTLRSLQGQMRGTSHVEALYLKLRRLHLHHFLVLAYRLVGSCLRSHLEHSVHPSLRLFALYKLLYYSTLDQ